MPVPRVPVPPETQLAGVPTVAPVKVSLTMVVAPAWVAVATTSAPARVPTRMTTAKEEVSAFRAWWRRPFARDEDEVREGRSRWERARSCLVINILREW